MKNGRVIARIGRYLYRFKGRLVLALILSLLSNASALAGPALAGRAVDAIAGGGGVDFAAVTRCCALMAGCYALSGVLAYSLSRLMIGISQRVVIELRRDLFGKLSELPVSYFDNTQTGDILSRFSYDADTVAGALSGDLVQIFTGIFTVGGALVMMCVISLPLVSVFAVTIPLSVFATRYLARKVRPLFKARSGKLGELNGFAEEKISGHKTVKAYHAEESVIEGFAKRNAAAADAYYRADYYGTVTGPAMNLVNNLSVALVSLFGVLMFLAGGITLGGVSSFTLYSRKFSGPVNEFANVLNELQSAAAAAERIFRIIDENPETPDTIGAHALSDVRGEVSMRGVSFGYTPDRKVLSDVSFDAPPGKVVAIVGPTGGGKTTVINLLMRFYDPDSGEIRVDGQDCRAVTRASLRAAYSMVLQDTWLFYGTLYDNVAYARPDASAEEVAAAVRAASLQEYADSLPNGYDTVLDEDGMNISKGQKQLITIARALLSRTRMLILDEATSNVDTNTEIEIQRAMLRLMRGKTCFVIAHRLSTVRNADTILFIRDGRIAEQGTHDELMTQNTLYAEMYRSQFE
jgi:ATP-binding cassette subfamily B protein